MKLIMVIHCHQPVGNFDHVFHMAHEKCYRPLLDLLHAWPEVRVGLHFSGPLLEWIEDHRPATLALIASLVGRGQVEPLSGGFFEPLLASIPVRDARGQITMMNDYLENRFGFRPRGFWLTERVWDPGLPRVLAGTGMEYTVVDDTHFYYAGLGPEEIYGSYVTEREGHPLNLLATPMTMRYIIPFRPVDDVLGHLRSLEDQGHGTAVYGDDGEKFGLWPGTHEWVIERGWLEGFFRAVTENRDWLKTVLPGDYVATARPLGRIYLPQASYEEMTEWALPVERGRTLAGIVSILKEQGRWDQWRPFVRGGIWDNFLVKYEEANRMHKKMLFLSEAVENNREARAFIWRAQCNCAYWHGIFGGLYLGHLRRAVYQNLIKAQALFMEESGEDLCLRSFDFDRDGAREILFSNRNMGFILDPGRGGGLFDLSDLCRALNLSDTLTRREEAYHGQLSGPGGEGGNGGQGIPSIHDLNGKGAEGLGGDPLLFDGYTRTSLLDHFLGGEVVKEEYAAGDHRELGDFVRGAYRVDQATVSSGTAVVELSRRGRVDGSRLEVRKTVRAGTGAGMVIDYAFQNLDHGPISALYGCEFNLTLYSDQDEGRYYRFPETGGRGEVRETGSVARVNLFELVNVPDGLSVVFSFSVPVSVWFFPIMTVSKSEEGFERTYQGSSLLFLYPLGIDPGETARFRFELELENI